MRVAAPLLLLSLAVLVAAGCGSQGGRLTRAQLALQADRVCGKTLVDLRQVQQPAGSGSSLADTARHAKRLEPIYKSALVVLQRAKPPTGEETAWTSYLAAHRDEIDALGAIRKAAANGDRSGAQAATQKLDSVQQRLRSLQRRLDFLGCIKPHTAP